jgi:tetratricopeptide (TPR) repeat protein
MEKWPFFALSAIFSAITVAAVARTWEFGAPPESSPLRTLLQVGYLMGLYLGNVAWPVHLSTIYAPPLHYALSEPAVARGIAITVALAAATAFSLRFGRGWLVGWSWFLIALAPTFGILRWSSVIAYDRYVYFPGVGLAIAAGVVLATLWRARGPRAGAVRASLVALVLVAAAAEARGTRAALQPWRDSLSIWRHAVERAPLTPDSHNGLGAILEAQYDHEGAIEEFRRAIQVDGGYGDAHLNLGGVLTDLGRRAEAIPHLVTACAQMPRSPRAACVLGMAYKSAGRLDDAAAQFRRALEIRPGYARALTQLGFVEILQRRPEDGLASLRRAVMVEPEDGFARFGLGLGLLNLRGADPEVVRTMKEAVALDPTLATAQDELAWLLCTLPDSTLRDVPAALHYAARAVKLTHGRSADALDTQGAALAAAGRFDEAVRSAGAALDLAVRAGDDTLAAHIRDRIGEYRRGAPHREAPS